MFWKRRRSRPRATRIPWTRFIGPGVTLAGLLSLLGVGITQGVSLSSLDGDFEAAATSAPDEVTNTPLPAQKPGDRIRVATFNIKVFGKKKSEDTKVMNALATICQRFDLVAIQEIRSHDVRPLDQLVEKLNAAGQPYACLVSKPIGRTSQTEQYGFLWDRRRIRLLPDSYYVVADEQDRMHREPMVATFQTTVPPAGGQQGFQFTLINVHTDPDEVGIPGPENEMNALDDVYLSVREFEYARQREDDIILLGDLNVDIENLAELGAIRGIKSVTGPLPTNTAGTKQYDHILINETTTREYLNAAGVFDFAKELGIDREDAMLISDHLPVWAEFSAFERPAFPAVAARPATTAGAN